MKTETFFAPLIRGVIMEKVRGPWLVSYSAEGKGAADGELFLTAEDGDEKAAAEKIAVAFNESKFFKGNKIPIRVRIICNGKDYVYLTAPHYEGIEKIYRGEEKRAWDILPPNNSAGVKDRIALVTGGAQGFGEEITRGLVSAGALVFIADLNKAGAEKLAADLNGEYGKTVAFAVEVNVGDEASVEGMAANIALSSGGLDLCVSNAGVLRAAAILEQDIASFRFVTEINYTAFAIVTKHCGLLMKAQHTAPPRGPPTSSRSIPNPALTAPTKTALTRAVNSGA